MFKKLFKRKRDDLRFVDAESYHVKRPSSQRDLDEHITVLNQRNYSVFEEENSDIFLEVLRKASLPEEMQSAFELNEPVEDNHHAEQRVNSLGVFSDSKIYSALIHSILSQQQLNLKHFNHPASFVSESYAFFDDIDAWIIFVSEEGEEAFLERFLDRYADKPCLFLVPKMSKNACINRIKAFLKEHGLMRQESNAKVCSF